MKFTEDLIADLNDGIWLAVKWLAGLVVVVIAVFFLTGCSIKIYTITAEHVDVNASAEVTP